MSNAPNLKRRTLFAQTGLLAVGAMCGLTSLNSIAGELINNPYADSIFNSNPLISDLHSVNLDFLRNHSGVSPEFVIWLKTIPQVYDGLLLLYDLRQSESHARFTRIARNMEGLWRSLHPVHARQFADLVLALSLRDGDALVAPTTRPPQEASVLAVAAHLKSKQISLVEAISKSREILTSLNISSLKTEKFSSDAYAAVPSNIEGFWDKVAIASGTYPSHDSGTNSVEFLHSLIAHYYNNLSALSSVAFDFQNAPYPLASILAYDNPSNRLKEFYFNQVTKTGNKAWWGLQYGTYTKNYDLLKVKAKVSNWHPHSSPRIVEDGGVCGRLSLFQERGHRILGVPSGGIGQPGHRAFFDYNYSKNGVASLVLGQSILRSDRSGTLKTTTNSRYWLLPYGSGSFENSLAPHYALISSINRVGIQNWHLGVAYYHLASLEYKLNKPGKAIEYVEKSLQYDPFNLDSYSLLVNVSPATSLESIKNRMIVAFTQGRPQNLPVDGFNINPDTDLSDSAALPFVQATTIPYYGDRLVWLAQQKFGWA